MYDTPRCAAMLHSLDQLPSTFSFMYCFGEQPFSLYYFQSHECTNVVLWGMAEVGELQHRSFPDTPWYCRAGQGHCWRFLPAALPPVCEQIGSPLFWKNTNIQPLLRSLKARQKEINMCQMLMFVQHGYIWIWSSAVVPGQIYSKNVCLFFVCFDIVSH